MKRIASFIAAFVAVTALVLGVTPLVSAQSTATRCTVSKARLVTRIDKVEAATKAQTDIYNTVSSKVSRVAASAKANGYKADALITASQDISALVTTYTEKAAAYSTALKTASDAACGENDGTYMTALATARTAMTDARTASAAVRTAVTETVIPELQQYATFLKENN